MFGEWGFSRDFPPRWQPLPSLYWHPGTWRADWTPM